MYNAAYVRDVDGTLQQTWPGKLVVGPPATLEGKRWKLGAWALYRQSGPGDLRGYVSIAVVAVDACGTWIEYQANTYLERETWKLCFGPN